MKTPSRSKCREDCGTEGPERELYKLVHSQYCAGGPPSEGNVVPHGAAAEGKEFKSWFGLGSKHLPVHPQAYKDHLVNVGATSRAVATSNEEVEKHTAHPDPALELKKASVQATGCRGLITKVCPMQACLSDPRFSVVTMGMKVDIVLLTAEVARQAEVLYMFTRRETECDSKESSLLATQRVYSLMVLPMYNPRVDYYVACFEAASPDPSVTDGTIVKLSVVPSLLRPGRQRFDVETSQELALRVCSSNAWEPSEVTSQKLEYSVMKDLRYMHVTSAGPPVVLWKPGMTTADARSRLAPPKRGDGLGAVPLADPLADPGQGKGRGGGRGRARGGGRRGRGQGRRGGAGGAGRGEAVAPDAVPVGEAHAPDAHPEIPAEGAGDEVESGWNYTSCPKPATAVTMVRVELRT